MCFHTSVLNTMLEMTRDRPDHCPGKGVISLETMLMELTNARKLEETDIERWCTV